MGSSEHASACRFCVLSLRHYPMAPGLWSTMASFCAPSHWQAPHFCIPAWNQHERNAYWSQDLRVSSTTHWWVPNKTRAFASLDKLEYFQLKPAKSFLPWPGCQANQILWMEWVQEETSLFSPTRIERVAGFTLSDAGNTNLACNADFCSKMLPLLCGCCWALPIHRGVMIAGFSSLVNSWEVLHAVAFWWTCMPWFFQSCIGPGRRELVWDGKASLFCIIGQAWGYIQYGDLWCSL